MLLSLLLEVGIKFGGIEKVGMQCMAGRTTKCAMRSNADIGNVWSSVAVLL